MDRSTRARWAVAALGCAGLLCAVLGAVMILAVPTIIKQQVYKVSAGPRWGLEGPGTEVRAGEAAAHLPSPTPTGRRLGAKDGSYGPRWRLALRKPE